MLPLLHVSFLGVATDPLALRDDDLSVVVDRVRREVVAAGKNKAPVSGGYHSPLGAEERDAVMRLLHDGTYARSAARIGGEDPDLADQ
ncbi:MAG: hypothetical protein M3394_10225 [Actinomycetota bacterium]|nr:hypothetical protein [Actinomycetota bacterium]